MEKLQSSLRNMILVLVGLAVVVGALLAWVNHITTNPIKEKADKTLADGIKTVMGTNQLRVTQTDTIKEEIGGKPFVFIVHHANSSSGKWLGAAVESTSQGFGGDLKILVGFNTNGDILGYTILSTQETPGLGAKADRWFQKGEKGSIIGKNPSHDDLTVTNDGGEVDAITASTITSRAFLRAVVQAYSAYAGTLTDGTTSASSHHHENGAESGHSEKEKH